MRHVFDQLRGTTKKSNRPKAELRIFARGAPRATKAALCCLKMIWVAGKRKEPKTTRATAHLICWRPLAWKKVWRCHFSDWKDQSFMFLKPDRFCSFGDNLPFLNSLESLSCSCCIQISLSRQVSPEKIDALKNFISNVLEVPILDVGRTSEICFGFQHFELPHIKIYSSHSQPTATHSFTFSNSLTLELSYLLNGVQWICSLERNSWEMVILF